MEKGLSRYFMIGYVLAWILMEMLHHSAPRAIKAAERYISR